MFFRVEDYSLDSMVQDLIEIIGIYGSNLSGRIILIAHSFGTMVAVKLAEAMPHWLLGLGLVAPISSVPINKRWITKLPTWLFNALRWLDRLGGINSKSVQRVVHPSAPEEIRQRQLVWNSLSCTTTVQLMLSLDSALHPESYRKLEGIPLLIICGESDAIAPLELPHKIFHWVYPESVSRQYKLTSKSPTYFLEVVEGSGHNPMVEKPQRVNSILANFISRMSENHLLGSNY